MEVAWIAWRSAEKVREYWDKYRCQCWDWHYRDWRIGPEGEVHSGYFLEQRRPAHLRQLRWAERYDAANEICPSQTPVADAERQLWDALEDGAIEATGIDWTSRRRLIIPRLRQGLEVFQDGEREVVRICEIGHLPKSGYDEVALKRTALAMWPGPRPEITSSRSLPLISPEGPGYMPLFCAAYWIATKGGSVSFDASERSAWEDAYSQLLARISSNEVTITGIRDGERHRIEGHVFAGIRVDYPFSDSPLDLVLSDEMYLYAGAYLDDEHWHRGFDDKLETRREVRWAKLLVLKSDVLRWWSFARETPTEEPAKRTGAPGRPSSMHHIEAEHAARWDRAEAEVGVRAEARAFVPMV